MREQDKADDAQRSELEMKDSAEVGLAWKVHISVVNFDCVDIDTIDQRALACEPMRSLVGIL
jgi:hypothetical protein